MDVDKTDKKIINALIDNSRQSYRQIAKKLGFSVATVMNRVNKLEKEKILTGYFAQVNYEKLGYDMEVIVDVRIAKGKLAEVEKKIASHPNVFSMYDNTGTFDATIIAKFRTRRTMDAFLKKIQSYSFVERTETKLILNTVKEKQIKLI